MSTAQAAFGEPVLGVPGTGRLARTWHGAQVGRWPGTFLVIGCLVPLTFLPLAATHGGGLLVVPYQHFYIVSAVSLLATLVAAALAIATVQIGLYRVLLLCLGFMSMGACFAVHGLTTPGILVPNLFKFFVGSAVATSAYLSLDCRDSSAGSPSGPPAGLLSLLRWDWPPMRGLPSSTRGPSLGCPCRRLPSAPVWQLEALACSSS